MQRVFKDNRLAPDLTQTKVTPRTRPTHEAGHDGALIDVKGNPWVDPDHKYVLVPADENHPMNVAYYESQGYEQVLCQKDGVRIRMGSKPTDGKPLQWRGMTLMRCTKERAQEIFQYGASGNTGQAYFDKLMARIRRDPVGARERENIQGLHERYDINDPDGDLANNTFR